MESFSGYVRGLTFHFHQYDETDKITVGYADVK